ncbi:MAG: beta strand repeat-containing protein, partial [Bacteroidia bacterium]
MKKFLSLLSFLIAFNCAYSQNTCATAVPITQAGLPFASGSQTTCGKVDNYGVGSGSCNTLYGGGEDYVYSLSITSAPVTLNFTLGGTGTYKMVQVYSGCPSPANGPTNCVGNVVTGFSTTGSGTISFATNGTYYVVVDTWPAPLCDNFTLNIAVAVPPANDNCAGATAVTSGASCTPVSSTVLNATQSSVGCAGTANDDVWFSFVATQTAQQITVTPSASFDPVVQVYSGTCAAPTSLLCDDIDFGYGTTGNTTITGLTVGATYYYRVYDYYTGTPPTTTFTTCVNNPPPPPANDNCAGATPVTSGASCTPVSATVLNATQSSVGCAGTANDDVWFSFVATQTSQQITVTPSFNFDPVVQVYSGSCAAPASLLCDDIDFPWGSVGMTTVSGLTVGATYYYRVYDYWTGTPSTTTFTTCVNNPPPPPANDNCPGAVPVTSGPNCTQVVSSVGGATQSSVGCAGTANDDVWFSFVATQASQVITVSPPSGFDPIVQVYSGSCASLTSLACNDINYPWGSIGSSTITGLTVGATYYYRVYDYSTGTPTVTTFTTCVNDAPPPPPPPVVASDCSQAVNICTNASFSIDPNGQGSVNETPTTNTISNPVGQSNNMPLTPPGGYGCLQSGELNSTWMIVNCQTSGTLEFSLGAGGSQSGCYDWIMWPYSGAASCNGITNNTLAPIRCCWNSPCSGGTGIGALPLGSSATNFGQAINVTCGQQFIICFSNYSSVSTTVPLNFFGTSVVSCTPTPNPITVASQTICVGSSTTLTASGAAGNTYTWTPGGTGTSITVSPTVTTTYNVSGTGGCGSQTGTATATVTVNGQPSGFSITNGNAGGGSDPTPASQCVQNDIFNFTSVATTGTVTHSWNFGGGGATPATSTAANPTGISYTTCGTYTVTHTVTQGTCTSTTTMTVNPTCPPTVTTTPTNASCGALGSAVANPTGGTPAYTYSWAASGGTGATASNLNAGTYTVTVTDANGCTGTATATIATTGTVSSTFTSSANQCLTGNSFTFTNTGASGAGVTYSWTFNPTAGAPASSTLNNYGPVSFTTAGTYTVSHTVTQGSCTSTTTQNVTIYPMPVAPTLTMTPAACGGSNGSVTVTAPTGAGITYSLNGGAFTATTNYTALAAGTYTITVKDGNGCNSTGTIVVGSTTGPTAVVLTPVAAHCGQSNGSFTIGAVTGGTAAYTYSVNASAFTATTSYTGLATGTYTVVVKDANGCTYTQNVTVPTVAGPTAQVATPVNASCGGSNGSVTFGATTGGVAPYTFSFNGSPFTATTSYTGLAAGTYNFIVKDNFGCTFASTVTVGNTPGPTAVVLTPVNASCGTANGSFTIGAVTGGTAGYTYSVNGGAFSATTSYPGQLAGTYTVTVKDANGCLYTQNVTINNNSGPTAMVLTPVNSNCGAANGSFTI